MAIAIVAMFAPAVAVAGQWVDVGSPLVTGRSSAPVSGGASYGGAPVAGYLDNGSSSFRWTSPWNLMGAHLATGAASYATDGSTLYQAGVGKVHAWNGSAWSQFGPDYSITNAESGDPLVTLGAVASPRIAWDTTAIVGFQQFIITDTGGGSSSGSHGWFVRRWTGSAWERLSGTDKAGSLEQAWAVRGDVTTIGGTPYTCWSTRSGNNGSVAVARWDGSAWTRLATSVVPFAEGAPMCSLRGHGGVPHVLVYRSGYAEIGVYAWNGSAWNAAGTFPADPARTSVSAGSLLSDAGELLAAHVQYVAGVATLRVHTFDGETWRALGSTALNPDAAQPALYPELFAAAGSRHVVFAHRNAATTWDVRVRRWDSANDRTATLLPGPVRAVPATTEWVRNTWNGSACALVSTNLVPAISEDIDAPVSTACSSGTAAHYIEVGTPVAATLAVDLGDAPADTSLATSLRIRTRAWKSAGRSAAISAEVRRADGTLLATAPEFDVTTERNHSYVIDGLSLSKADVDGLYVVLRSRTTGNGSATRVFVTALNVELDYVVGSATNQAPGAPAALGQFRSDGITAIAGGAWTNETTAVLRFDVADPDAAQTLTPWVEMRSGATWAGSCGTAGAGMFSGTQVNAPTGGTPASATVTVTGLTEQSAWYWRACAIDQGPLPGPWTARGGTPDFRVDLTPPSNPTMIADGAGADVEWVASTSSLAANWSGATDALSGVASYDWCFTTDNANSCGAVGRVASGSGLAASSVTASSLTLSQGTRYFACVRSRDTAGNVASSYSCSDGQRPDTVDPNAPSPVNDGSGADIDTQASTSALDLNWSAATDTAPGQVAGYEWCLATATDCGGTVVASGTATSTSASATSLTLVAGTMYYGCARTRDGAGNVSPRACSDGVRVDGTISLSVTGYETVAIGVQSPGNTAHGEIRATVTSDATGYSLTVHDPDANGAVWNGSDALPWNTSGTIGSPASFIGSGMAISGFAGAATPARWCSGGQANCTTIDDPELLWAQLSGTSETITGSATPITSDTTRIPIRVTVPASQPVGSYSGNITLTAVAIP